jgi:O-methyltransferase
VPEILWNTGIGAVAFVHIDMNCALPERAAFEFFWERLSPGGVMLFDDYAYYGHGLQRQSIDEAARATGAEILSLPTGQGLIMK